MAAVLAGEEGELPWVMACTMAELETAAESFRGVFRKDLPGRPPLALFYRTQDKSVHCLDDACPHAGHSLSNGDIGDVEDIAPGCGVDLVVSCPAHAYIYDAKSGKCLSNIGGGVHHGSFVARLTGVILMLYSAGGGVARVWETRVDDNGQVFVGSMVPRVAGPDISREDGDRIQVLHSECSKTSHV